MLGSRSFTRRQFLGGSLAVGAAVVVEPGAAGAVATDAAGTIAAERSALSAFTHMSVRWQAATDVVLQVRASTSSGVGAWIDVIANQDLETGTNDHAALVVVPSTTYVQVRVLGGQVSNVRVEPIDVGTTPAAFSAVAAASEDVHAAVLDAPTIITRAQWGADESLKRGTREFSRISKLIVHHSDTANGDPDPAATVRSIYAFHVLGNGWDDIGYNFLIDESGRIYEGRWARDYAAHETHDGENIDGLGVVGAHAMRANAGSVGVCLLGNFTNQAPTAAALDALGRLFAWKASNHNIDAFGNTSFRYSDNVVATFPNICGHRDVYSTSCPGNGGEASLASVRTRTSNLSAAQMVPATSGYWTATRNGAVLSFGLSKSYGSMEGKSLNAPVVGMSVTPGGRGYWLLGADGGIFSFGDARFYGSTGGMALNKPVLALAPTPSANGYWLAASDGGVFCFGDAGFHGSMGSVALNQPVVGMASTSSGRGYWLVASDGGIFAFGDAAFYGSLGSIKLNQPIVAMAAHPSGRGYWMVAADGGIFAFGAAPYLGSVPGLNISQYAGAVSMAASASGNGYWVLASDGSVQTFGDATYAGDRIVSVGEMTAIGRLP